MKLILFPLSYYISIMLNSSYSISNFLIANHFNWYFLFKELWYQTIFDMIIFQKWFRLYWLIKVLYKNKHHNPSWNSPHLHFIKMKFKFKNHFNSIMTWQLWSDKKNFALFIEDLLKIIIIRILKNGKIRNCWNFSTSGRKHSCAIKTSNMYFRK